MKMNIKKTGFTLMELLLSVALIAVVAAIAAPTFYMNAGQRLEQARIAMLKARYIEIRTAIDLQLKDEKVLDSALGVAAAADADKLDILIGTGYLQPAVKSFEKADGTSAFFDIRTVANSAVQAQLPPVLRTADLHVFVKGTSIDLDTAVRVDNKTWQQIWEDIN